MTKNTSPDPFFAKKLPLLKLFRKSKFTEVRSAVEGTMSKLGDENPCSALSSRRRRNVSSKKCASDALRGFLTGAARRHAARLPADAPHRG